MMPRIAQLSGLVCLLAIFSIAMTTVASETVDLFDGESLDGWRNPYDYGEIWVEDGAICLRADKKFFLVTDKEYGDFVLEAEVQLPSEGKSNSGIMFRCHVEPGRVYGYQAECDPEPRAWTGGLYDEGRRGWLYPDASEKGKTKIFQAPLGEWIKYRIECRGDHLQVFVNGQQTLDLHDDTDAKGHIGLQHHGERGQIYRFRNITLQEI